MFFVFCSSLFCFSLVLFLLCFVLFFIINNVLFNVLLFCFLFFIINSFLLNCTRVWISLVGDMRGSITNRKGKHYRADLFVQAGRLSCLSG